MVDIGMVEIGLQDESLVDHIGRQVLHWIVGYSTAWYATLSHCDLVDNFKKVDSGAKILLQGLGVKTGHNDDEDDDEAEYGEEEYDEVVQEGGAEGEVRRVVRQRRRIRRAAARGFVNRYHPLVEYGERNFENLMLADLMENCERGIPIEMFNVLAPFHQNSAGAAGAGVAAAAAGGQNVRLENMQVTQPCSGPSSPTIASPGALSSTSFCLANGGGIGSVLGSGGCSVISSTTAADTADPNWQANKSTVRERNAAMFNNELMADIRFIVGSDEQVQTIPAHKYVLATGSSVFYAMFYGGLAENKQEIKVPDVEPGAFLTLLKYLYCDEIQLEADNVLATLYVAKKYIVPHLARACVNYLETSLTAKNACLLLSQSRLFEEPELMQRCWEVIDAQAEMAIKSEGFVDIDLKTFETILARETLNCKEIHLFEAALSWAHAACTKMDIEPTSSNKRQLLGQALYLIRIPTMTLEEFANRVAQLGILTNQETIDIFLNFTAKNKPKLTFPVKARAGLKTQVCHRFASCAYRSNQWRYRGRCDSIQFSVDKRIFIVGFGLYGSSTGAADYDVKIELKRLGRVLAENSTKFFSDGSSNTFQVFFETPIQIEPECFYTASVVLDGTELSFFGQEGMSEVSVGTVTFQFQCSSESTNGTGVQGGQIPELIFYGPMGVSQQSSIISASASNNTINNNHTAAGGHTAGKQPSNNSGGSSSNSVPSTTTTSSSSSSSSSAHGGGLLLMGAGGSSSPSNTHSSDRSNVAPFGNGGDNDGASTASANAAGIANWLPPSVAGVSAGQQQLLAGTGEPTE
ncbi:BTB/POZ domain-containing protein 6-B isoform X1 [Anopheles gambiae]|uniref:BTB/POZ domain-containing protein 6-B isoform X1 n=1 Tax=Anopheles gambiae TaxID=7165 RepID=UPI002AC8D917|nr:BTB/POZ domain-containing protein 6-B isoform X1 [Anopheles gambiae]XP_061498997.1 BTB/POZ domain-containing protein 6-B isoform X1 [Anopheles gambiae]XP_061498998.1 BTB/POZ domain-containing protein 6-B isoform X1 [Anopheles gambiae]XP_061498999.1 BTB/POZ domain-containing protein 6-B isoform X1 [Anopheles gambiae]XP_061499000.1 BTB/POZ domain-containing protein 6-B isoform X1 [Anopheles gambiae]XP_061499001.1 BTB/POZ domain-containing protein 6-B isoform X1 [Anopheles gambiae]XP_06149900